jgi:hypothetical protein
MRAMTGINEKKLVDLDRLLAYQERNLMEPVHQVHAVYLPSSTLLGPPIKK